MIDKEGYYVDTEQPDRKYRVLRNANETLWMFFRGKLFSPIFTLEVNGEVANSERYKFVGKLRKK